MASEASIGAASDTAAVVTPPERADEIFLEGPRSRFAEFCTLLRVMRDFLRGYRALHFVGPCVTVFGSERIKPDDPHYELALKMGAAIARLGFTVMTGGGPGIMEAANRGAKEAGGRSVGCNIELPFEQTSNTVSRPLCPAALFFCSQSAADKIFLRLRCYARRRRHPRRAF